MAAVLACGQGAVLSHRSAAELWRLLQTTTGAIHVTVPGAGGRSKRQGLIIHRPPSLPASAIALKSGIRLTSPARTIADLRRTSDPEVARRAEHEASFRGLAIGSEAGKAGVRSELERRFLYFCSRRHLPRPEVNWPLGPYRLDFAWPLVKVCAETDGWAAHRGRRAFEDDHERDLFLGLEGWQVVRFTWRMLEREPRKVAALLRRRLG